MKKMPKEKWIDCTFSFLQEGFTFIGKKCRHHNTPLFKTRIFGKKVICMCGEEAAHLFYDNRYFERIGVVNKSLFSKESTKTLGDTLFNLRNEMFLSLISPENLNQLIQLTKKYWELAIPKWQQKGTLVLFTEVQKIMCKVACEWVGIEIDEDSLDKRSQQFIDMIDDSGGLGQNYLRVKLSRLSLETWLCDYIREIRKQKISLVPGTAAHTIVFKIEKGKFLKKQIAAMELINIISPIVAIAYYINYAALSLFKYPTFKKVIQRGDEEYAGYFVQEVRRCYPFTPFVLAKVKETFEWKEYKFTKGTLALLDLIGTNNDPSIWDNPHEFLPDRFRYIKDRQFSFILQWWGDNSYFQRYAGEKLTNEATKVALVYLARYLSYEVPEQDLSINFSSLSIYPKSGFIIKNVKRVIQNVESIRPQYSRN